MLVRGILCSMNIGIWGDSITYGGGDSEALGWPGRLRKSLSSTDDIALYNFGICGDTTEDLLKRFDVEAEAIEPSEVIFAVGINDSKYPVGLETSKVPLEDYKSNLEALITKAKRFTESMVIVGATKVNDDICNHWNVRFINEEIEKYNAAMAKLAAMHNLKYIDVFEVLNPTTDLADGLHPNAQGYQKMFEVIRDETSVFYEVSD